MKDAEDKVDVSKDPGQIQELDPPLTYWGWVRRRSISWSDGSSEQNIHLIPSSKVAKVFAKPSIEEKERKRRRGCCRLL